MGYLIVIVVFIFIIVVLVGKTKRRSERVSRRNEDEHIDPTITFMQKVFEKDTSATVIIRGSQKGTVTSVFYGDPESWGECMTLFEAVDEDGSVSFLIRDAFAACGCFDADLCEYENKTEKSLSFISKYVRSGSPAKDGLLYLKEFMRRMKYSTDRLSIGETRDFYYHIMALGSGSIEAKDDSELFTKESKNFIEGGIGEKQTLYYVSLLHGNSYFSWRDIEIEYNRLIEKLSYLTKENAMGLKAILYDLIHEAHFELGKRKKEDQIEYYEQDDNENEI